MTYKEFVSYFQADLFIPSLDAENKNSALERMVAHLIENNRIKRGDVVLEALKKRESLGSTGVGKSIAIPHGRTTVTGALTVVYARSVSGIPWDASDKKPAHFVFLILAPHQERANHYLPLLGRIVEFVRDAAVRRKLLKVDTHAGLLKVLEEAKAK